MRRTVSRLALAMTLVIAANQSGQAQSTSLRGTIEIDGSSTVFPISEAAASGFNKKYPTVKVNVGVSGTGGGFKRFTIGEIDISDASRPIKDSEFAAAKEKGVRFFELPVAYDGLTLVVHKSNNWVDNLTVDEVKKIFTTEGGAKTWDQVRAGWPNKPVQIFAPGTDSGTFDYFKEVVVGSGSGSLRADMSTSEDDNVLVTGVSGSPNAIGFFGIAYYEENKEKLRSVPIVNPETGVAVSPTAVTVEDGSYAPFSRPLFIYVNEASFRRPEVRQFVGYYLQAAPELAKATGYVPLPQSIYKEAMGRCRLQDKGTGTHYLTNEMKKRSGSVTDIYKPENLVN
jgi:phosphate transport system substrate-binding protein